MMTRLLQLPRPLEVEEVREVAEEGEEEFSLLARRDNWQKLLTVMMKLVTASL